MNAYGIVWYGWVLIFVIAIKPLVMPFLIGREREPFTAMDCFLTSIVSALYVLAVVELAT